MIGNENGPGFTVTPDGEGADIPAGGTRDPSTSARKRRVHPGLRRGITLTEVLIVIVLVALLAGMLLPVLSMSREVSHPPSCSFKLSQIMGACVAYGSAEETLWPSPWPKDRKRLGIPGVDSHEARLITVHSLAILAQVMSMPNALFTCPSCSRPGPSTVPSSDRAGALAWGAGPDHAVSYAWDWAAPAEPGASRVVGADRSPANHKGKAMAVFGDSHAKPLKCGPGTATGVLTEDNDGAPVTAIVGNPDAAGAAEVVDNIYSPDGDGGDALAPSGGDAVRVWVK